MLYRLLPSIVIRWNELQFRTIHTATSVVAQPTERPTISPGQATAPETDLNGTFRTKDHRVVKADEIAKLWEPVLPFRLCRNLALRFAQF
jgi:hypothetical protein